METVSQPSTMDCQQVIEMSQDTSPLIHPTAIISTEAQIADDVQIGPWTVIEGPVVIGPGCVIDSHVRIVGATTLGAGNRIFSGTILGEAPQDMNYKDESTRLIIGSGNVFREHVTIHRGSAHTHLTKIGDSNFLMVGAHVAHDCIIGNQCILANGAMLGGHCRMDNGAYVSGNSAVHQFCSMGRLAMLSGLGATSKDIPPFVIQAAYNQVGGVNVIGMKRAGHSREEIHAIRQAFRLLYREGHLLPRALEEIEQQLGTEGVVGELIQFVRNSKKGIVRTRFLAGKDVDDDKSNAA